MITNNNNGVNPLEIYKSVELKISDGRAEADSLGRATFHGRNGISVIGYAIYDQYTVSNVVANSAVISHALYQFAVMINGPVAWLNVNRNTSKPTELFKTFSGQGY